MKSKTYGVWVQHTAGREHECCQCHETIPSGAPVFSLTIVDDKTMCGPCGARIVVPAFNSKRREVTT